jgi:hypothetical protein
MQPLSISELSELRVALVEAFQGLADLRERLPAARFIKYPQVPPVFTESLTIHLLEGGMIPELKGATFGLGRGRSSDIVANVGGEELKIEVKGCGEQGMQQLGRKDIASDYLVWINFGRFFHGEDEAPLVVWTVERVGRFFPEPLRNISAAMFGQSVEKWVAEFLFSELLPTSHSGLPVSPCRTCGALVVHTEDDKFPLCKSCDFEQVKTRLFFDILEGRLEVPSQFDDADESDDDDESGDADESDDDESLS